MGCQATFHKSPRPFFKANQVPDVLLDLHEREDQAELNWRHCAATCFKPNVSQLVCSHVVPMSREKSARRAESEGK